MFRPVRHSNREHGDGSDAKFRALMFTCLVFYMNMEYLLLLFCYVFLGVY